MNTSHCETNPSALCVLAGIATKEEDIGTVNRMVASDINNEGDSVSDNTIGAHCDEFSPEPILMDQHKLDHEITTIRLNNDKHNTD